MLEISLLGLFFGTIGTTIGGVIGIFSKSHSNKFLSFILAFASGLMLAVVSFDLIPEAMEISSIMNVMIGIIAGIMVMIACDILVQKKFNVSSIELLLTLSSIKSFISDIGNDCFNVQIIIKYAICSLEYLFFTGAGIIPNFT